MKKATSGLRVKEATKGQHVATGGYKESECIVQNELQTQALGPGGVSNFFPQLLPC